MDKPVELRMPTDAELAALRQRQIERRARRIPELTQNAYLRLVESPGREWSQNELLKTFCDSSTRIEFRDDVWKALLELPGVTEGPEVVRGGRRLRQVSWHAPA